MTTYEFFTTAWTWNSIVLILSAVAFVGYFFAFGKRGRPLFFAAALVLFLLAFMSPFSALANGYLFSAHMVQHILIVLIVPALLLLSLPRSFSPRSLLTYLTRPLIGWVAGVGAMWLWHAPTLCNAAPAGIVYLFTACTACSVLGIILTFAPVSICPVYQHPVDRLGMLSTIRGNWGLTSDRDQQIGGLLMWVPMCAIYVTAILAQIARWHSCPVPQTEKSNA